MPKVRFHYFDARARAEISRLILAVGGTDYDDVRINGMEGWLPVKKNYIYEQIPLLEWDGIKMTESRTIMRFLARQANLMGGDAFENAVIDEIADAQDGMMVTLFGAVVRPGINAEARAKIFRDFRDGGHKKFLDRFEFLMCENDGGNGYLVGKKLTWGDLVLFHVNDYLTVYFPSLLNSYPKLKAHYAKILEEPGVKAWRQKRPQADMMIEGFRGFADKL